MRQECLYRTPYLEGPLGVILTSEVLSHSEQYATGCWRDWTCLHVRSYCVVYDNGLTTELYSGSDEEEEAEFQDDAENQSNIDDAKLRCRTKS